MPNTLPNPSSALHRPLFRLSAPHRPHLRSPRPLLSTTLLMETRYTAAGARVRVPALLPCRLEPLCRCSSWRCVCFSYLLKQGNATAAHRMVPPAVARNALVFMSDIKHANESLLSHTPSRNPPKKACCCLFRHGASFGSCVTKGLWMLCGAKHAILVGKRARRQCRCFSGRWGICIVMF